ncbi:Gfo/Idh/MocA family protein [Actinomycetota bacterium Odt1-20B]
MANWGFLGAGSIAQSSLGPAVHAAQGATLHAVAARDERRARLLKPAKTYESYPDLLADPDVDIVYVALHNSAHRLWVEEALAAGKHVLCEKPLGLSATEVDSMIQAAHKADRMLVEAAWNRWHPRTRDMEALLETREVGTVEHVAADFHGIAPDAGNYRREHALGGGALYDVGFYAVSLALAAFDWQVPQVRRVQHQRWSATSADSAIAMTLGFPGGGTADIACSLLGDLKEEFTLRGSEGTVRLSDPAYTAGAKPCELELARANGPVDVSPYPATDPYQLMVENIDRALSGRTSYVVPIEQSLLIAQVIDAALKVMGTPPAK